MRFYLKKDHKNFHKSLCQKKEFNSACQSRISLAVCCDRLELTCNAFAVFALARGIWRAQRMRERAVRRSALLARMAIYISKYLLRFTIRSQNHRLQRFRWLNLEAFKHGLPLGAHHFMQLPSVLLCRRIYAYLI